MRKIGRRAAAGPDAKSQLSLRYENGKPVEVTQLVLSTQHTDDEPDRATTSARSSSPTSARCCPTDWLTDETEWWVNPTGTFVIGGP